MYGLNLLDVGSQSTIILLGGRNRVTIWLNAKFQSVHQNY